MGLGWGESKAPGCEGETECVCGQIWGVVLPLGLPAYPTPNSKPGTYLMAFFSLRPRPESGVPTVSKEFL